MHQTKTFVRCFVGSKYCTMKKGCLAFFGTLAIGDFLPFLAKLAHQTDLRPPACCARHSHSASAGLACIEKPIQSESGVGSPPSGRGGAGGAICSAGSCGLCFCSATDVGYKDKLFDSQLKHNLVHCITISLLTRPHLNKR